MQGVSWTISKEYITIKPGHYYTWAHKAWVNLMQLGAMLPEAIRYYHKDVAKPEYKPCKQNYISSSWI